MYKRGKFKASFDTLEESPGDCQALVKSKSHGIIHDYCGRCGNITELAVYAVIIKKPFNHVINIKLIFHSTGCMCREKLIRSVRV